VPESGFRLIAAGRLLHLFLYRQSGGAVPADGITASVRMAEGSRQQPCCSGTAGARSAWARRRLARLLQPD